MFLRIEFGTIINPLQFQKEQVRNVQCKWQGHVNDVKSNFYETYKKDCVK